MFRNPDSRYGQMALLAFEKAPFSAIFSLSIQGAGQPGPRAENREWGQEEQDRVRPEESTSVAG